MHGRLRGCRNRGTWALQCRLVSWAAQHKFLTLGPAKRSGEADDVRRHDTTRLAVLIGAPPGSMPTYVDGKHIAVNEQRQTCSSSKHRQPVAAMANSSQQPLIAAVPGILDQTADQLEKVALQLEGLHHATDSCSTSRSRTTHEAIQTAANSLERLILIQVQQAGAPIAGSVLRHARLCNALLELLVLTGRWKRHTHQTAQQPIPAYAEEQLQCESTAGEINGLHVVPDSATVLSCRLLGVLSYMLLSVGGANSGAVQGSGTRRVGAAAAGVLEPGGPSASNRPSLSLLALDLGCALLRMHTLQCCSRQLAAVCAWMGGDGEEQQAQQQQQQQEEEEQLQHKPCEERGEERQRTGAGASAGAGQEQGREEGVRAGRLWDALRSSLWLVGGLLHQAKAAMGVLGRGEGPTAGTVAAAAEAAQRADLRRLSRRFLLLLASHLRDSHLLEHCARAAVMAAVGPQALVVAGGSASGEAVEGPGQGQGQAQAQGVQMTPAGLDADVRHALLHDCVGNTNCARDLVRSCMQAPAPASTLIGPVVREALTGPAIAHLELVLGLHALCTADGGPEYGMPVSYRALPAVWKPGRTVPGPALFAADFQVMRMMDALKRPEQQERCLELLGGMGPMLTLQLRVCEFATASAEVHGQGEVEEQRRTEESVHGGAGRMLRHVMDPQAMLAAGLSAHLALHLLLLECWQQQQQRRAAVRCGGGGPEAAGAGTSSVAGLQDNQPFGAGEPIGSAGAQAAVELGRAERAASAVPEAAVVGSGGWAPREEPDVTVANGSAPPGSPAVSSAVAAKVGTACSGDVAPRLCAGGPAGAGGAAGPPAAVQAAEAVAGRVSAPRRSSRRPLSLAALRGFQVRWWRCVCRAAEHVVPLRLGPGEQEAQEVFRSCLARWLRLQELALPDPLGGPLPPAPPPRLAAALEGGLLPCLEGILRRAARDPEGSCSKLAQEVLSFIETQGACDRSPHLLCLMAYGEVGQSVRFLSALASLLPQPGCASGGSDMSRPKAKAGPKGVEMSRLAELAVTAACAILCSGFELWAQSDPLEDSSSGSSNTLRATCTPGVQPPERCRLQHVLAHATWLMLPQLARFVRFNCGGADGGQVGRPTSSAASAQQRQVAMRTLNCVVAASAAVLNWVQGLSLLGLDVGSGSGGSNIGCGSGDTGGSSSSGGGSSGGGGGNRNGNDADRGLSSTGSTGGKEVHDEWSAVGGAAGGRARAASQQQQQQEKGALKALHDTALRRFLLEEVQAVEVLGAVLHYRPSLNPSNSMGHALATALSLLTAAYPNEVRRRVAGAAGGCKCGGSRNDSRSVRGGGGAKKQRGASGAEAGSSSLPDSLWPVELVRQLAPALRAHAENENRVGATDLKRLAGLLEAWKDGSLGEGEDEGVGAGGLEQLRVAIKRLEGLAVASASMTRALYEVLSAPAAPLVA